MSFPQQFTERLKAFLVQDYTSVMNGFSLKRKGSFRMNTLLAREEEVLEEFKMKNIVVEKYDAISGVFTFDKEYDYAIKGTDAFYKGKIYLQSIASMLPVLILDPKKGDHVLDVCAAPGSKTTQIALMMQNEGQIIALEQNQIRFDKLMYNARLQGATIIEGKKMDARKYFEAEESKFDRILLDAPCSAEGRISLENEKSYGFWSLENIKKKADLQYELLSQSIGFLKQGGTLVYSTCTLAPEENEGVISKILGAFPELSLEPIEIGLSEKAWWRNGLSSFQGQDYTQEMKKTVRVLPSEETEGFYIAKLQMKI